MKGLCDNGWSIDYERLGFVFYSTFYLSYSFLFIFSFFLSNEYEWLQLNIDSANW